jgi:protease IV
MAKTGRLERERFGFEREADMSSTKLWSCVAIVMLAGAFACKPQPLLPRDDASEEPSAAAEDEDTPDDDGGAAPFGMPPMAKLFTRGLEKPGPYDEPKQSPDWSADAPHFVVVELEGSLGELESFSMFGMGKVGAMRKVTARLREAAGKDEVRGLLLRATGLSIDMATAQELRDALVAFKGAGDRRVVCHTEHAANAAYHVLTACDRIGLAPLGEVSISGPAATPVHVKGLLDRLNISADFIHVGAFKGAAEPITREAPSPEMIETLEAIVERSYRTLVEGIEQGRGLDREAAEAAIDRALFVGEQALEASLVDQVAVWETFRDTVTEGTAWKRLESKQNPLADFASLQRFVGLVPPKRPKGPHVAVVTAVGNIIDGKGSGIMGAREEIASRTLVAALRALEADVDVRAVVLRIDSGGGSARASEQIWMAASELAQKKPLVVSMGSVAASGGYYIAAPAKKIYARENTLTGSIGVVGGKLVFGDALASIGVKTYAVKRGERALMWSTAAPWTRSERDAVSQMMEVTYERFLDRVARGRSMKRDDVHEIAQGRVWTGADAKARGLVDELGGLDAALADAHRMAGLEPGGALQTYPPEPTLRDILSSFGGGVASGTTLAWGELAGSAAQTLGAELEGVEGILRTLRDLRNTRIWAVSWVRPPR